jgi:2-oxoglutarate dehydrogenase E2 component (dihydrolipoamide succinyltransferase)
MAIGTAVDVVMPQMGVSVSEGTITKWLKSEGDPVAADEPLLEISTDKVDTEVPCPADGVLGQILVPEGETVPVGTVIASVLPPGAEVPAAQPDEPVVEPTPPAPAGAGLAPPEPALPAAAEPAPAPAPSAEPEPPAQPAQPLEAAAAEDEADGRGQGRAFVSPVVARIAAEHAVDVSQIPGTGRGGRVTKKDILQFLEAQPAAPTPLAAPSPAPEPAAVPAPPPAPPAPVAAPPPPPPAAAAPAAAGAGEILEPMSVMRRAIAEHMIRSAHTSAHVTTVFEIDMSKVVAIRERLKREYEEKHGVKLTYLAFIARAVIDALARWPRLNAEIRGDQIVLKSFVNLGIAVALDDGKGLIVPVVRNAEEKNLLGIARAVQDLADRARSKKLLPDEVHGGTFTITNPGGFGAIAGTPIINQPQVGILDVEAIVKRPVVVTDEFGSDSIAIRPMMNLCLSYDHRLVDGAYAAPFMRDLKIALETWDEQAY